MPAAEKLLWIWAVTVLVIFTISKARMPNYVLPAFPPTFALLGACLAGLPDRLRKPLAIHLTGTFLIVAGTLVTAAVVLRVRFGEAEYLQAGIALAGVALLALPAWLLWKRQPILAIVPLVLAGALAGISVACGPARAYCAARSAKALTGPLAALDPRTVGEVVMATEARYGVIFYAPPGWQFRRVTLSQLNSLLPLLNNATKPLYAILTGGGILRELQQDTIVGIRVSKRLTVLQRWGQDALVRINPPAASGEPAQDYSASVAAPGSARRLENFTAPRPPE
jgi:4-amino-4-deoxy-L-arabinose transferase-like glycosyltransferase